MYGRFKRFKGQQTNKVDDIIGESRSLTKYATYEKNADLLTDEVLGKKRAYSKNSNPVAPSYVMPSQSGRARMLIENGADNRPKVHVRDKVNKDSKRYLRSDDILGAAPKVHAGLPQKYG